MSETNTEKTAKVPQGKISFESFHIPAVPSGEYSIQPRLDFTRGVKDSFTTDKLTFEVAGPRFNLSPNEVHAIFPPRDALGEFDNVLPHIEINRSTLPWERVSGIDKISWLGLILLQEDELNDKEKVRIEAKPWTTLRDELGLDPEVSDEPDHQEAGADEKKKDNSFPPVKVLELETEFLKTILPTPEDIDWLTHIRVGHDPHGKEVERAVIVCNRMPRSGSKAAVHLVSFEHRFKKSGSKKEFDFTKGLKDGKISLLSLVSWQFSCPDTEEFKVSDKAIARIPDDKFMKGGKGLQTQLKVAFPTEPDRDMLHRGKDDFINVLKNKSLVTGNKTSETDKKKLSLLLGACRIQTETFKGLMDALDMNWMRVSPAENDNNFFKAGSIPMAHGLRKGGKTASWYRGPFISNPQLAKTLSNNLDLPVRNSDQLLLFDNTNKMLDASYAAAWELGRLLSISQPRISQQIAQWKTSHARESATVEQQLVFSHVPFTDSDFAHKKDGQLNQSLQNYFKDLGLLKSVPFQYLVPNEQLLPHESLRFFHVDPYWVETLLDGAFSIGRTTELDNSREKDATATPHKNERKPMTGILLRSDLVSGWPSLIVEGYDHKVSPTEVKPDTLDIRRFERLGPNVLLVLFEGVLKTVDIHLPAESLHFGFNRPVHEGDKHFKELKSLEDGSEVMLSGKNLVKEIVWRGEKKLQVLDMKKFTGSFTADDKNKIKPTDATATWKFQSGQLAVELLEGVPRLRVNLS